MKTTFFFFRGNFKALRKLSLSYVDKAGRNREGKIVVRFRGGGVKRRYRLLDLKRKIVGDVGLLKTIEKDPFRNAFIGLVLYRSGILLYQILVDGVSVGDFLESGHDVVVRRGNVKPIGELPTGTLVCNLAFSLQGGGQIARSAGCCAKILKHFWNGFTLVQMPSKEQRFIFSSTQATIGVVSNGNFKFKKKKKAGQNRWLGRKPNVRGVAMNPVDHPHGGGEGRTSGGRLSVSFKGVLTKGFKTVRRKKRVTRRFIFKKRK